MQRIPDICKLRAYAGDLQETESIHPHEPNTRSNNGLRWHERKNDTDDGVLEKKEVRAILLIKNPWAARNTCPVRSRSLFNEFSYPLSSVKIQSRPRKGFVPVLYRLLIQLHEQIYLCQLCGGALWSLEHLEIIVCGNVTHSGSARNDTKCGPTSPSELSLWLALANWLTKCFCSNGLQAAVLYRQVPLQFISAPFLASMIPFYHAV